MNDLTGLRWRFLVASAGIVLVAGLNVWETLVPAIEVLLIRGGTMGIDDIVDTSTIPLAVTVLFALGVGIAFIVWLARARRNLRDFSDADPTFTPGWAIGGWMIPLGNLVIPGLVTADIARNSVDPRSERTSTGGLLVIVWAWWGTYAARAVLDYTSAFMIRTQVTLETGYWITVAAYGLTSIAAAVLAILVMWRIGAAQAERYAANPWQERPTDFPAFTVDHLLADEPATAEPQPETGPAVRAPIPR